MWRVHGGRRRVGNGGRRAAAALRGQRGGPCTARHPRRPRGGRTRRSPRSRRDRGRPVRAREPARALRVHLRSPGGPVRRRTRGHRRIRPVQRPPGPRPGVRRGRSQARAAEVLHRAVPALTGALHTPAAGHEGALSVVTAVVLLVLFGLSLPAAVAKDGQEPEKRVRHATAQAANVEQWPLALAIGLLAAAGVGAAFVSEWFVAALTPAMDVVHISPTFAGLVIVAIAGNAVENVVGIQLALRNQADYALSVILQSPLQVALVVAPVLVLAAPLVGATFTLVLSPLLLAALLISALVTFIVVFDGESTWFEGTTLIGLYVLLAAGFWWG